MVAVVGLALTQGLLRSWDCCRWKIILVELLLDGVLSHVANCLYGTVLRVKLRVSAPLLSEVFEISNLNVVVLNVLGLLLFLLT